MTFTFAAAATGFTAADVAVGNGSAGALVDGGSGTTFTMTVTPSGRGLVTIAVGANACTVGGVGNENANLVVNHDPAGPLPTFSIAPLGGAHPGQKVWLTISFSEEVSGLALGDFTVSNGSVSDLTTVTSGRTYRALVTIDPRPNASGTVTLGAGAATGGNARASQAASIELVAPVVAPVVGGDKGCGLGSGLALLLLLLVGRLQGGPRFTRRTR